MFAKNLKEAMARKGISSAELSRRSGSSKAAISQYLSGINNPSRERVAAIAAVLDVPVEVLMIGPDAEPADLARKTTLTCKEAATLLHKHESFVRAGLQQGRPGFEYGSAVKTSGKWSYCIYADKFTEVTGIPVNV